MEVLWVLKKLRGVLIGGSGQQGREYRSIMQDVVEWVCIIDPKKVSEKDIKTYDSLESALSKVEFDMAFVTTPHDSHFDIVKKLLKKGHSVIKEKPLAMTYNQALELKKLCMEKRKALITIVQRNFDLAFVEAKELLKEIGDSYWFKYEYHMNFSKPTSGWRASRKRSGGGVLIDMGYHAIDIINHFFGYPVHIDASLNYCFSSMRKEFLEDSAIVNLKYGDNLSGTLMLTRHHHNKKEEFEILGTKGSLKVRPKSYDLYSLGGKLIKSRKIKYSSESIKNIMLLNYIKNIDNDEYIKRCLDHHLNNVKLIEDIYKSSKSNIIENNDFKISNIHSNIS